MVSATSTNTLGFLVWSFLVSVLGWLIAVINTWADLRKRERGWRVAALALTSKLRAGAVSVGVVSVVAAGMWTIFLVRTAYYDHAQLVELHARDAKRIEADESRLNFYRYNVSTRDPVFGNLMHLLQSFAIYRNGVHGESCVVRVTAPRETLALASMLAQFSIATSNCPTFGPDELFDRNPDLRAETMNGMVPDAIVFHAVRDDKAANELFVQLSSQFKLVRSYEMPAVNDYQTPIGGYAHTVWLQFGSRVKWNGEPAAQ
ncbi:MAG: hypothetical protein ACRD19_01575 [Terriglobia bacterium]